MGPGLKTAPFYSLGGVDVQIKLFSLSLVLIGCQSFGQSSESQCQSEAQSFISTILNKPDLGASYLSSETPLGLGTVTEALNKSLQDAQRMYKLTDQKLNLSKALKQKIADELRALDYLVDFHYQELSAERPYCHPETKEGRKACKQFYGTEKKRLAETFGISKKTLRYEGRQALKEYMGRREEFAAKLSEIEAIIAQDELKKKQLAERILTTIRQQKICDEIHFNSVQFKFIVSKTEPIESTDLLPSSARRLRETPPSASAAN
jgi:hypothetical protein